MKRFFRTLCVLLGVSVTMTSCLNSSDDTTTTYTDTAITAITFGTLNRYTQTTSSTTGNDTIIKSTLTGSAYSLTINQLNGNIYNEDVFPAGTDLKHVLISSVSTKNNGIVTIKSLTSDTVRIINTTDSIDFSTPRTLRVYSSDLSKYRDYTVTLYVDEYSGVTFGWKKIATNDSLKGWTDKHIILFDDTLRLVDKDIITKQYQDVAFRINGQTLERSENLKDWNAIGKADVKQLLGASTTELFALGNDNLIKCSKDDGVTWQNDTFDDDTSLMPVIDIAMTSWEYASLDSADYTMMVGTTLKGDVSIWRKINLFGGPDKGGMWSYMPVAWGNMKTLPRQSNLTIVNYNNNILALGSNRVIYQSRDQGITWQESSTYALPASMKGTMMEMILCYDVLWIVTDAGEIWQGTKR